MRGLEVRSPDCEIDCDLLLWCRHMSITGRSKNELYKWGVHYTGYLGEKNRNEMNDCYQMAEGEMTKIDLGCGKCANIGLVNDQFDHTDNNSCD